MTIQKIIFALVVFGLGASCGRNHEPAPAFRGSSMLSPATNTQADTIDPRKGHIKRDKSVQTKDILYQRNEELEDQEAYMAAEEAGVPAHFAPDPEVLRYLTGNFDPKSHKDFVVVGKPYTDLPDLMLRKETFEAFRAMWLAARKEGISLKIVSGTRNFDRQKAIWEGKWERYAAETPDPVARAKRILEYSSMPGSSRHHWGTDIDLNDLENKSFEKGGKFEKAYRWLNEHAADFGFCQPYTPKGAERPNGYNEEKWHWSYLPLSRQLTEQYRSMITNQDISGFKGAETAIEINIVDHYVLGISQDCL